MIDSVLLQSVVETAVKNVVAPLEEKLAKLEEMLTKLEQAHDRPRRECLSPDEVAVVLGCSRKHVRRLISTGKLPSTDIGLGDTACFRITRDDLAAFMQKNRIGGRVPPPDEQDDKVRRYLPKLRRAA